MLRRELLKLAAALPFASLLGVKPKSPIWKGAEKSPPTTQAISFWTGNAGNFRWDDPRNWDGGVMPTEGCKVYIYGGEVDWGPDAPTVDMQVAFGKVNFGPRISIERPDIPFTITEI